MILIMADINGVVSAVDRARQPSDIKNNEEEIIRKGYVPSCLLPDASNF